MKRISGLLICVAAVWSAHGFNQNYNASNNPRRWSFSPPDPAVSTNSFNTNTLAIRYYIAADAFSTTNTTAELNAVRDTFGQWQSVTDSIVKFEDAGLAAPGYAANTSDNSNVVFWAKESTTIPLNGGFADISGALGVAYTSSSVSGNILRQFDIVLNGVEKNWFTDFNDKNNPGHFVEGVLGHEVGHALGMEHSSIGGATLLFAGRSGVDLQAGLSADEIAFARAVYPGNNVLAALGHLTGTVLKDGSPVLGAAVVLENTNGLLAGGAVTRASGTYILNAVPPGSYHVRVVPLDPIGSSHRLIRGPDVSSAYSGADTSFLPIPNTPVTLTAGVTNTLNFTVTNAEPDFRITWIRRPTTSSGSYSISSQPNALSPGQSNYFVGVLSSNLPTSGATFTISGDGLTVGSPSYATLDFGGGLILNAISASLSVASDATPGLRSFTVASGTNCAFANGYLEILPTVYDYNFDGLDDTFQRQYFSPFTSAPAAPGSDPDNDGMNNYAEYIAGTAPTNAASLLRMLTVSAASNGATPIWQSVPGKRYQVSSRADLIGSFWQNIGSPVTVTGTNAEFLDNTATNGVRFYRVQALP